MEVEKPRLPTGYIMSIRRVGGEEIWSGRAGPADRDSRVRVTVPLESLPNGDYLTTLRPPTGSAETASFYFRLRRT
jgi:hypothetical protein